MTNTTKQDEVKLLINEEKISMCVVIETQVSKKLVNKVGDYVFGNWAWVSNSVDSNRGCRIMVGWDRSIVGANLNTKRERKPLLRNLTDHCVLVNGEPWVVLGDFNVTIKVEECSNSFNVMIQAYGVFRRVLCNLDCFANFLPYMTSDHCPATLIYTDVKAIKPRLKNMKKHFRNMNRINGNVFDKVKALRVELKRVQSSLDNDPNCVHLREEEYVYCNAYKKAISDEEKWFNKENDEVQFSVKEAWKVLRDDVPKVMWYKHFWFSQCIPRHSFILWMALKGRLKTHDRISRWFNGDNMVCPFCKSCKDSHSHLFFRCGFAQGVWNKLKNMYRLDDLSFVWAEIVSGIAIRKANNTLWSIIQRLVFGAAIYFIWQECNFRLFWCVERSADKVFDIIVDTVRLRLLGLKIKRSPEVDKAATIWKLLAKDIGMRWDCRDEYDHNDDIT
ncbi:RNA-directed DNA polymerase, eukaryota, reverse transcriptase zinc-binding domain protein [Tanacetum coccineum]|uniref:RNA-directed DNA polymerase, eukaryota, reverse transcriptase zinc-binding domain protein n=1 Tax=Tanacetum coccineum TaxID=301880 RepID=A0ABQ4WBJ0_9ASTR